MACAKVGYSGLCRSMGGVGFRVFGPTIPAVPPHPADFADFLPVVAIFLYKCTFDRSRIASSCLIAVLADSSFPPPRNLPIRAKSSQVASVMIQPSDIDDHSSDAHDTLEDEQYPDHPRGIEEIEVPSGLDDENAVQGVKISTSQETKEDSSPMHDSSRGGSLSTNPEQISDGVSVHSLPVVHVTESDNPLHSRPSTGRTGESSNNSNRALPSSPSRSQTPQEEGPLSQQQRRARHRSAIEVTAILFITKFVYTDVNLSPFSFRFVLPTGSPVSLRILSIDGTIPLHQHREIQFEKTLHPQPLGQQPTRTHDLHHLPLGDQSLLPHNYPLPPSRSLGYLCLF
jgi:hypothetical protein